MEEIQLGQKATDTATGYTGTVVACAKYLHGSDQLLIVSKNETNNSISEEWVVRERCVKA
jgi:hypothetical protein